MIIAKTQNGLAIDLINNQTPVIAQLAKDRKFIEFTIKMSSHIMKDLAEKGEMEVPTFDAEGDNTDYWKFRKMVEESLVFDCIKAVYGYLKADDTIVVNEMFITKGKMGMSCTVTRNGVEFAFDTENVLVRGEIKILHMRYIIKTKLPKLGADFKKVEQRVKKSISLADDLKRARDRYTYEENNKYNAMMLGSQEDIKMYEYRMKDAQKDIDKLLIKITEYYASI